MNSRRRIVVPRPGGMVSIDAAAREGPPSGRGIDYSNELVRNEDDVRHGSKKARGGARGL